MNHAWTGLVASIAVTVASLLTARDARAQSFDTVPWRPLSRSALPATDAVGPGTNESDVVGDVTYPAAFVGSDATHLYLRVRVNDAPTNPDTTFKSALWGCVIDTDGVLTTYEFLHVIDGNNSVQWRHNKTESIGANVPIEPAEVLVATALRTTHARAVDTNSATPFSDTPDFFVDMAMPWAVIEAGGAGAPKVAMGSPMRFICGTSALTFDISNDQATTVPSGALDQSWSDAYVCASTGCVLDTPKPPMDAGVDGAVPVVDAGPKPAVDASVPSVDASVPLPPPVEQDEGALAGTGLICAASRAPRSPEAPASAANDAAWIIVASALFAAVKLRRSSGR